MNMYKFFKSVADDKQKYDKEIIEFAESQIKFKIFHDNLPTDEKELFDGLTKELCETIKDKISIKIDAKDLNDFLSKK